MSAPKFLRQLADPDSPAHILSYAAITGALTLLAPWRRKPGASLAIHTVEALAAAATTTAALQRMPALRGKAGYVTGVIGIVIGLGPVGDAMNRRLDDALTRRGVRNVPAWFALGATAATALSIFTPKDSADAADPDDDAGEFDEHIDPLDDNVRSLIGGILDRVEGLDVSALRTQLADTRQSSWEEPGEPVTVLQLVVDGEPERFTPRFCELPVRAQFEVGGDMVAASVFIDGGRLQSISVDFVTEPEDFTRFEGVERWPNLADVRFVDEVRGALPA